MINTILKTKIWKVEPKKLTAISNNLPQFQTIYRNFKQSDSDQFKLDICNSMFDVRTQAAFDSNLILDKHSPKKNERIKTPF